MLRTILAPLDGSPLAERALPFAATLARTQSARLVLVPATTVHSLPGIAARVAQRAAIRRAEVEFEAVAERLRQDGFTAEVGVYDAAAAEAIVDTARHALQYLEGLAAPLRAVDYRVPTAVEHGAPAPRIAEYARREQADRVVLPSHGRGGVAWWLNGSIAEGLLREGPAPLAELRGERSAAVVTSERGTETR